MAYNLKTIEQYEEKKDFFIKKKLSFQDITSNTARYLRFGNTRYYFNKEVDIPDSELWIFQRIDREAVSFLAAHPEYLITKDMTAEQRQEFDEMHPDHIDKIYHIKTQICNASPSVEYDTLWQDCVGIDISSAYVAAALKLGVITKKTFAILQKMTKATRLAAFGSIASCKEISYYQNGVYAGSETIKKETRNLFFECSQMISDVIIPIMQYYEECFFCFVDAIFLPPHLIAAVTRKLKQAGYSYKIKEGLAVKMYSTDSTGEIGQGKDFLCYEVANKETGEAKGYTFSKRNYMQVYNAYTDIERALYSRIKTQTREELKEGLALELATAYGSNNIDIIPLHKVKAKLNEVGLNYADFITINEKVSVIVNTYDTDSSKEKEILVNRLCNKFIADFCEKVKDLQNFTPNKETETQTVYTAHQFGYTKTDVTIQSFYELEVKEEKQIDDTPF